MMEKNLLMKHLVMLLGYH
ncbi:unnamed protein product [Lasius platythorax]|uniref:Uncharacterized protein n=1 Tax=Lasius platythorax TaxID=488582 RepID=A0AAV2NZA5_9HYME